MSFMKAEVRPSDLEDIALGMARQQGHFFLCYKARSSDFAILEEELSALHGRVNGLSHPESFPHYHGSRLENGFHRVYGDAGCGCWKDPAAVVHVISCAADCRLSLAWRVFADVESPLAQEFLR